MQFQKKKTVNSDYFWRLKNQPADYITDFQIFSFFSLNVSINFPNSKNSLIVWKKDRLLNEINGDIISQNWTDSQCIHIYFQYITLKYCYFYFHSLKFLYAYFK